MAPAWRAISRLVEQHQGGMLRMPKRAARPVLLRYSPCPALSRLQLPAAASKAGAMLRQGRTRAPRNPPAAAGRSALRGRKVAPSDEPARRQTARLQRPQVPPSFRRSAGTRLRAAQWGQGISMVRSWHVSGVCWRRWGAWPAFKGRRCRCVSRWPLKFCPIWPKSP
jgi:hypothetical protein